MNKAIAFVLACTLSFFLFVLMQFLVNGEVQAIEDPEPQPDTSWEFDIENLEPQDQPRPKFEKPEYKEPVKKPENLAREKVSRPKAPIRLAMRPSLDGIDDFGFEPGDPSVHLSGTDNFSDANGLSPRVRIEPNYPPVAARDGKQGFVTLRFDINKTGSTENIRVVEAKPKGVFESASRKAVRKWRYTPQLDDGKPIRVDSQTVTLSFKLEE